MTGDTLLEMLQADVAAVLENSPALAGVAVLTEDAGDMEKKILQKLGPLNAGSTGQRGLVCVVMLPEITEAEINLPGPPVTVTVEIQMIEQPLVNRGEGGTGIRSSVAALRALASLQLLSLGYCAFSPGRPPVATVRGMKPGYLSHAVTMTASFTGMPAPIRPGGCNAAWLEDDTLRLSCASGLADIYVTLDGSYPSPANPQATLYTEPIAGLTVGTLVRAAGWLADAPPGPAIQLTIASAQVPGQLYWDGWGPTWANL